MPMKYNGMVTVGVVAAVLRVDEAQPLDVRHEKLRMSLDPCRRMVPCIRARDAV